MSDDDTNTSQPRKRRTRLRDLSSDSDSDSSVLNLTKRKKAVVESDSSSESSGSVIQPPKNVRRTRKMARVETDESSSSSSSEDSVDEQVLSRRLITIERDDSDSDESSSVVIEEVSESGLSSAESSSSEELYLSDDESMVQAAIQESLEGYNQSNENHSQEASAEKNCGFSSDASDGQSEKCPICLVSFTTQKVGTPETCDHTFCAVCIQEWAKNVNTCPVDRLVFTLLLIRKQINGKIIERMPVQNREAREVVEVEDADPTFCEVCGQSDREDRLLLCDSCDQGYHMECLEPPLERVPVAEWYCPECGYDDREMAEEVDIQEGELHDLLDDDVPIHLRTARLLPRTRQSERVRATIRSIHEEQQRTNGLPAAQPSTSGIESMGADSSSVASGHRIASASSVSTQRRRKPVRRKTVKIRRKRRITKRKTTRRKVKVPKKKRVKGTDEDTDELKEDDDYAPKPKRRKRRKRKIKHRKKKVARRRGVRTAQSHAVTPRSVKGRLAEQLGLRPPNRPGMSLPVVRSRGTISDIDTQRSRAGIPTLHIYGQTNQLDYFSESDNEEMSGGDGVAVAARHRTIHSGVSRLLARKRLSAAALQSHTAVTSPKPVRQKVELGLPQNSSVSSGVDLVGSILDSQSIWHSKTSSVTIRPDGSLEVSKEQKAAKINNPESGTLYTITSKDKSDGSLIRSDDRLSEVTGPNSSPVDVGSASGRTTQAPMYPGRGGNSNRPPPPASFHQFGGNRYSAPTYQSYGNGRNFSNFPSASNFDDNNGQAGYSNYNSNLPAPPFRNTPVRFRVTPRYPVRRGAGPPRQAPSPKPEKKKTDSGESSQKNQDEEEEIDIYSDIEAGGGGSGGPSAGGSEQDETERNMDAAYEALPPPPEPSALLMGLGEQVLSDEDPGSDSELVIDDVGPESSPHDLSEASHNVPDSEKYDPADPSRDSDDEPSFPPAPPTPPTNTGVSNEDIPLPPDKPDQEDKSKVSLIVVNSSSNSSASYLHSPTYGDTPAFETEKLPAITTDGMVNKVVKEVIQECLSGTSRLVGVEIGDAGKHTPDKEDDADECPNFSIYSAASMDIARRTEEEQMEIDLKEESRSKHSEQEGDEKDDEIISCIKISDHSNEEENMEVADEKNLSPSSTSSEKKEVEEKEISNDEQDEGNVSSGEDLPLNETEHEENAEAGTDHVSESNDVEHDGAEDEEKCEVSTKSTKEDDRESADVLQDKCDVLKSDAFESDDESLVGGATSAVSAGTVENNVLLPSAPSGLEGLDTETISETEEAINFDDELSQDGNELASAEEDGEISSGRKKKKKKSRRILDGDGKESSDLSGELSAEKEKTPLEEGEIIDDRPKVHDSGKKEKKSIEKKDKAKYEKESTKVLDENFDVSKSKDDDKKKKKKEKRKSAEKKDERPVLGSSENKRKSKEKSRKSEENISWKKPSKNTKERNYRDTKTSKADETVKDREEKEVVGKEASGKKKKKEKRKDMERYDVRKIVSDKRRRRKDEFGRDLSRDRTYSRSRSRSHQRSHDRSRQKSRSRSKSLSRGRINRPRHQSPGRLRRSQSRSRFRSRSRSYRRSQSRSRNRSKRSKERNRRSRSKDRTRMRVSRSRSRGRRSRSRSHSRPKNKARLRSRSRSLVKARERKDRSHILRGPQRFHARRSWSRTWTPSWSRSHSRSLSCSSFTHSRSPSVRFNRSFSRSFSRSWSRERYERIPLEKTGALSSKAPKKLTVIVSNTKDTSDRQKKDKKKKKERKNKDTGIIGEKRKKRKEKSPAPSKEVFTSGDNILVSVNFNKSKLPVNKEVTAPLATIPKEAGKRKRDETFETERELGKKMRKEKTKDKNKGTVMEKSVLGAPGEKKLKKQLGKGNKSARMAAALKQKPVAIIDLDQSPFREQTPSPRDLIVLSDSDDDAQAKEVEREEMEVRRGMRSDSTSPQSSSKGVLNVPASISGTRTPDSELPLLSAVSNYLLTSTGPKTPPEPQVKFSIATKQPQIRSISNPLQEDDILPEDGGLDESDRRIVEELERGISEILHKGPNTPPEPRGPTTPCSPPTSPDAYDPFDPTKSGTPSPAGPEASMDGPPSPPRTPAEDVIQRNAVVGSAGRESPLPSDLEDMVNKNAEVRAKSPSLQTNEEVTEETCKSPDRNKTASRGEPILAKSPVIMSDSVTLQPQIQNEELPQATDISEGSKVCLGLPSSITPVAVPEAGNKSPDRKMSAITTQQTKLQSTPNTPAAFPVPTMKAIPTSQAGMTSTPSHSTAPAPLFPALTPVNIATILCTPPANLGMNRGNLFNPPAPLSVPSLLQHAPQTRLPPEKVPSSTVPMRALVQNGEQLPKPQDITTEVVDMDLDSPYSPGSSEGDDLFDPPADTPSRANQAAHPTDRPKPLQGTAKSNNKLNVPPVGLPAHKSPNKSQDKFDSLFGKMGAPAPMPTTAPATGKAARSKGHKGAKTKAKHAKGGKKEIAIKMDEDQLQILDELPSSAVELQVKDKFLKKLNRQERVVEEVKLSLKPHYNRKHITKEEYKNILRKSVPKICHNKSGEINPIKIASLVEAYVRKVRYEKKKTTGSGKNTPSKAKGAKTTMRS